MAGARQWQWGQRHHAYYHPVIFLRTNPLNVAMLLLHFVAFWGKESGVWDIGSHTRQV